MNTATRAFAAAILILCAAGCNKANNAGTSDPEIRVMAVNPAANFVILNIGATQGAVIGSEMILKRGDSQIARVRISQIEPSTSVADIIPGSMAPDLRLQPGDRAIFPGT
jgi:hypothetical protein